MELSFHAGSRFALDGLYIMELSFHAGSRFALDGLYYSDYMQNKRKY